MHIIQIAYLGQHRVIISISIFASFTNYQPNATRNMVPEMHVKIKQSQEIQQPAQTGLKHPKRAHRSTLIEGL